MSIMVQTANAYIKRLDEIPTEELMTATRWFDENFASSDRGECLIRLADCHKELSRTRCKELKEVIRWFRKLSACGLEPEREGVVWRALKYDEKGHGYRSNLRRRAGKNKSRARAIQTARKGTAFLDGCSLEAERAILKEISVGDAT